MTTRQLEDRIRTELPEGSMSFTFSRSGGPGGQNVNKVSTRVTLLFDPDACPSLTERERSTIRRRLAGRLTADGLIRITSSRHRTQLANREATVDRLVELLAEALTPPKPRRATKVPQGERRRRLQDKRARGERRRLRGRVDSGD